MTSANSPYETDLDKNPANYQPLSPLTFLERSAKVYPKQTAVVHGDLSYDYETLYARCRRLGSALEARGIGLGDTVAIIAPNVPAMLEAHYGVPMTGAILNTINIRLDAAAIGFILDHGEAKVLIVDPEFAGCREGSAGSGESRSPRYRYRGCGVCRRRADWRSNPTRICSHPEIPSTPGRFPTTNGAPSRSTTRPEPPATPRVSSTTIAAPTFSPWAMS